MRKRGDGFTRPQDECAGCALQVAASVLLELSTGAGEVASLEVHGIKEGNQVCDLLGHSFLARVAVLGPGHIGVHIGVGHGLLHELKVGPLPVMILGAHEKCAAPLDHGLHV